MQRITTSSIIGSAVLKNELSNVIDHLEKRMRISNRSDATVVSYSRAVIRLSEFHGQLPTGLAIDQIIDFLWHLQHDQGLHWRTLKIYVAGLRSYPISFCWSYERMLSNVVPRPIFLMVV